jgi:hypothetical protein
MYTVDYFINKFEKIPSGRWTTGTLNHNGAMCALGHCGVRETGLGSGYIMTKEAKALGNILRPFHSKIWEGMIGVRTCSEASIVMTINDSMKFMPNAGAKARMLSALLEVKELEETQQMVNFAQEIIDTPVEEGILV